MWFSGLLTPQQIGELLQTRQWRRPWYNWAKGEPHRNAARPAATPDSGTKPAAVCLRSAGALQGALLQHGLINLTDDLHDAALTIRDMLLSLEE